MGRSRRRREVLSGIAGGVGVLSAGCGGLRGDGRGTQTNAPTVTVGSKRFAENRILGYMIYELLRAGTDLSVVDETDYGGATENWSALTQGEVDAYWEYTGTQYLVLDPPHSDPIDDPDALYDAVAADAREQGIAAYARAPFNNSFVLLVRPSWQEKTGVRTLSDLAAYINAGNTDFAIALGDDFYNRSDGWPGLTDHYDIETVPLTSVETKVVAIGVPYDLIAEGRVSVAMGFGTDPQIRRQGLVVLEDDRDYFPTYNPAPFAHAPTAERLGLGTHLDRLGPAIDGVEEMRRLNGRVILNGEEPQTVARSFLRSSGLIDDGNA